MFGIGVTEILVILVVALIVLGPQRLPEVAKALGKGLAELRRATSGLTDELREATQMLDDSPSAARRPNAKRSVQRPAPREPKARADVTDKTADEAPADAPNPPVAEKKSDGE